MVSSLFPGKKIQEIKVLFQKLLYHITEIPSITGLQCVYTVYAMLKTVIRSRQVIAELMASNC